MKYGKLTPGKIEALIDKLGGLDVMDGILDNTVEFTVTARVREFLRPAGEFTLPATTELFDPHVYFQSRKGLWVLSGFTERVLPDAQPTDGFGEMTVGSFDLVKAANDTEIRSELPGDHVFEDPSEFCSVLAKMIDQQSNGEGGNLLLGGYWNVFYARGANGEVFAVRVGGEAHGREWDVNAFPLDGHRWHGGGRVFSRNCLPTEASA